MEALRKNILRVLHPQHPVNRWKSPLKRPVFEIILILFYTDDYPKGKHDPDIFHAVLRKFDCEAEDVALFEDALYSIKTAEL